MRSFERRIDKLDGLIEKPPKTEISARHNFVSQQQRFDKLDDLFESSTADETEDEHEAYEDNALEGTVAVSLAELIVEKT